MTRRIPTPHWNSGGCRWCGEAVESPTKRKRTWHPECVSAYLVATSSGAQHTALWKRDRGICAGCRRDCNAVPTVVFEADHIVPLHTVDRSLPWAELRHFWSLDNLQTLCRPCHLAKCRREAGACAEKRRARTQPSLDMVPA